MGTPETQPSLFELPKAKQDTTDSLTPNGKKRGSIPTGMKRSEINKLGEKKGKKRTGNASYPNEY